MPNPERKVIVFEPGAPEYGDGYPFVSPVKPTVPSTEKEEPMVKSEEEIDFDNQVYIE